MLDRRSKIWVNLKLHFPSLTKIIWNNLCKNVIAEWTRRQNLPWFTGVSCRPKKIRVSFDLGSTCSCQQWIFIPQHKISSLATTLSLSYFRHYLANSFSISTICLFWPHPFHFRLLNLLFRECVSWNLKLMQKIS